MLHNKIDTQNKLKNKIKDLNIIIDENWTLSDQIMDYIAGNNKGKYRSYMDNSIYISKKHILPENAVGAFIFKWIELEKILKNNDMTTSYKDRFIRLKSLVDVGALSTDEYDKVFKIRSVRNNLVHGIEIPDSDYLDWCTKEIEELTQSLKNKSQKGIIDKAVGEIAVTSE